MSQRIKQKIRIRLLYWVTFTALGAGIPFLSLYYKHVLVFPDGTPAIELIGIIVFIEPLLGVFSNPLAGLIADKFKVTNRILLASSLFTMIAALFISIPGFTSFITLDITQKSFFIGIGIIIKVLDSTWMLGINSCIVIVALFYFIFFVKERQYGKKSGS